MCVDLHLLTDPRTNLINLAERFKHVLNGFFEFSDGNTRQGACFLRDETGFELRNFLGVDIDQVEKLYQLRQRLELRPVVLEKSLEELLASKHSGDILHAHS